MKVIFLDFDGVLNSEGSFMYETRRRKEFKEQGVKGPVNETFCRVCASNFQAVLDKYKDVKIVVSSTWRESFDHTWLKAKLEEYKIDSSRFIGTTPVSSIWGGDRGKEIRAWLSEHPEVDHYIIIDDNDWGIVKEHGTDRFVRTSWESGMTWTHTLELQEKLSTFHKKKLQEADAKRKAEFEKFCEEKKKEPINNDF